MFPMNLELYKFYIVIYKSSPRGPTRLNLKSVISDKSIPKLIPSKYAKYENNRVAVFKS